MHKLLVLQISRYIHLFIYNQVKILPGGSAICDTPWNEKVKIRQVILSMAFIFFFQILVTLQRNKFIFMIDDDLMVISKYGM